MNKQANLDLDVRDLYASLEKHEDTWAAAHNGELVSTFSAQVGKKFPQGENEGIIFYGRACNGWDRTCPNGTDDSEQFDMSSMDRDAGLRPFLRFCKMVSEKDYPDRWYDHIAWSNITKLTFCDANNPSEELWQEQLPYLEPILSREIKNLSPKVAIFVIGDSVKSGYVTPLFNAFPYLNNHKLETVQWGVYTRNGETYPLTATAYDLKGLLVIVTDRPEHQKYMAEHVACIRKMMDQYCQTH